MEFWVYVPAGKFLFLIDSTMGVDLEAFSGEHQAV
jgi:hypothetical protein